MWMKGKLRSIGRARNLSDLALRFFGEVGIFGSAGTAPTIWALRPPPSPMWRLRHLDSQGPVTPVITVWWTIY